MTRLDSLIRAWGYASRRELRELVAQGRVSIDGVPVTDPAMRCEESSIIKIDGTVLEKRESITLMMNKPAGYVCTADEGQYPTVFSLLKGEDKDRALFAVGRLDADTEGLLLLTNDGELCDRIIRPESNINKVYEVKFDRPLIADATERLAEGITLPEGVKCRPAQLEHLGERCARITVCEGKYHEVKRLVRACGAQVAALKRIKIGGLELDGNLKVGEYRQLSKEDISLLYAEKMI